MVVNEHTFDKLVFMIERMYDGHMFPEQAFHVKDHDMEVGILSLIESHFGLGCHTHKRDFV